MFKIILALFVVCSWLTMATAQSNTKPLCTPKEFAKKNIYFTTNIYGYIVAFQWTENDDFCLAYRNQNDPQFIMEFLPRGQALENWKNMFSLQGLYKIQAADEVFSEKYNFELPNLLGCETMTFKILQRNKNVLEYIKACGSYKHQHLTSGVSLGEITHVLMRRAGGSTYSFWFSERMQPFDATHYKFDEPNIKRQSKFLNSIRLLPEAQQQ